MSFSVIGGAPGVMRLGNYVHNFSPALASYLAGVKAAMLRPPALRTILLLLLILPFVFGKEAHAAADQQLPANWVPPGFEALAQRAAFHTDFTFDLAMLQVTPATSTSMAWSLRGYCRDRECTRMGQANSDSPHRVHPKSSLG
jgi:hypothetical protein